MKSKILLTAATHCGCSSSSSSADLQVNGRVTGGSSILLEILLCWRPACAAVACHRTPSSVQGAQQLFSASPLLSAQVLHLHQLQKRPRQANRLRVCASAGDLQTVRGERGRSQYAGAAARFPPTIQRRPAQKPAGRCHQLTAAVMALS